jgi:exodeoxyribonuclease VII large subunit
MGGAERTFTVGELCGAVRDTLRETLDDFWVVGEVQRLRPNRNGHLFFELTEKGSGDEIVGKLEGVIWRRDHREVRRALAAAGQEIAEGQEIRCRGGLDLYAPYGRLQLVVREIDAVFALGKLAARRRETLRALAAAGLLDRNAALTLPAVPLDLALVTARDSAAFHDFLATLRESGYGFRVTSIDAAMQGRDAERGVAAALAAASRLAADACVLIRGGGAKTDLAAFDSRRVAEAVARCTVPVLTGLGHQIDESIADRVAHTALKTPTKVAELLIERVRAAESAAATLERTLAGAVRRRLDRAGEALRRSTQRSGTARLVLRAAAVRVAEAARFLRRSAARGPALGSRRLERLGEGLARWAPRIVSRRRQRAEDVARQTVRLVRDRLRVVSSDLEGRQRLVAQLGPERVLARGFSITRDEAGTLVRRADGIGYGQVLTTQLARGTLRSRVEET